MLAATLAKEVPFTERAMMFLHSGLEDPLAVFLSGLLILVLFFWYFASDVDRRKRNVGSILIIVLTGLCVLAATPLHEKLKGGIDIVGGSSFTLEIQPKEDANGNLTPVTAEQVNKAIEIVHKRLDKMGTSDALIARQGDNGILVQMPGAEPAEGEKIKATLEKVAKLEFHKVHEKSDLPGPDGTATYAQLVMERKLRVPAAEAYLLKGKNEDGNHYEQPILLYRRPALGGKDVAAAYPSQQQSDAVDITLNGPGTDKMIKLTQNMREKIDRIAIVLDGEVISAPVVNQAPLGKNFIIEGLRDPGEPQSLANSLMNPLENPMRIADFRNVSPALGASVVKQAVIAGALSLLFTFLFVLLYYRFSGFIAIIGLIVNAILLFGIMAMFGFTFSLPGIAGMILTIGMAVDANVLIYERLREEIQSGKSIRHAIDTAYERAFTAIFDSNLTSLITSVILFFFGSGAIKGFAITLSVGIIASMFACILVTRVLFRWCLDYNLIKKLTFLNLFKKTNFDFMGKRRIALAIAGITLLMGIGGMVYKGERALGVDFTGGTVITTQIPQDSGITLKTVNESLAKVPVSKVASPQILNTPVGNETTLTIRCATQDSQRIMDHLRADIPALGVKSADGSFAVDMSIETTGAFAGEAFLIQSLIAIVLGLAGIFLYMTARFELAFAVGGFVAILHDVIICLGLVVLLGDELSLIHVGAILTIAGYSINDTIIVFDRIRETLLTRTGSIEKIMNEAVNATLSRTLLTSTTTIASVLLLWGLCGSALKSFGMIIFIGIVIGTFSSIFVAAPVVLWWSGRRKGRDLRSEILATEEARNAAAAAP
ncbi:MAG: protein translocase subunit SecD [Verrucomicrobiota bacterium]